MRQLITGSPQTCHDCGAVGGQLHKLGCDMERCPFCGHQLISCGCCYDLLGLRHERLYAAKTSFIQPEVYKHGLDHKQQARWLKILNKKGRIPWIQYPSLCARCGTLWPQMFRVPNEEWEKYIEPAVQGKILCQQCYDYIKIRIDMFEEAQWNKHLVLTQKELNDSANRLFWQHKRERSLIGWLRAFARATAFTLVLWVAAALGFVLAAKFGTIIASALITAAAIAIFTYLYAKGGDHVGQA